MPVDPRVAASRARLARLGAVAGVPVRAEEVPYAIADHRERSARGSAASVQPAGAAGPRRVRCAWGCGHPVTSRRGPVPQWCPACRAGSTPPDTPAATTDALATPTPRGSRPEYPPAFRPATHCDQRCRPAFVIRR